MHLDIKKAPLLFCCLVLYFYLSTHTAAHAQNIRIESRIDNGPWQFSSAVSARKNQKVTLRVPSVSGADIRWFQVIPDISIRYHNAGWPGTPDAYQWKGFDPIHYTRKALPQFDHQWEISLPEASGAGEKKKTGFLKRLWQFFKNLLFPLRNSGQSKFQKMDAGSFWFQAEVRKDESVFSSPGIEKNDARGLSPTVLRVSIRESDDLLGYLTSYFNVSAVFGSVPYQVRHYIGVDCADVLMAAYHLSRKRPITKDYNVAMLTRKFPVIKRAVIQDGTPDKKILWGREISAGDFIAVRYHQGRQFQHIGALYADANQNKRLDRDDLVLHAGPDPLHLSRFSSGVFDGEIVILRPAP